MPECQPNQYFKPDLDNPEEGECVDCYILTQEDINNNNLYPDFLESGAEGRLQAFFDRMRSSNNSVIAQQFGDLSIYYRQCENYNIYTGSSSEEAGEEINRNRINVDSGTWTILETLDNTPDINSRLNKCIQGSNSNNSDKSLDDIRICEIVNFYVNTDGYLTGATLDSAIMSQFGTPSTMRNNELERVLPPLPEELYLSGGNIVEDYKNFIHQNRGAHITDDIYRWIANRRIQEGGKNGIPPPSVDNILMEEIYEAWIELTNFKRDTPGGSDVLDGLSIQSFFEGQPSSIEFEMCMNNIFDNQLHNKYKDHDHNIQKRISEHTDITQLHPREVDYIEDKLKIIATLNPEDAMECMNILNIGEMICDKGVSDRMLKMGYLVMHIIGLDKMNLDGIQPGTHKYQKLKHILDRLTPYIRRAVKKILEISKYYEKQTCGFESASTHILETIYDDVFEKTKEVDINIQGLDLIPTYLIKDTNMMEFARTIILLIVMISGIYVLMMILNRPVAVATA